MENTNETDRPSTLRQAQGGASLRAEEPVKWVVGWVNGEKVLMREDSIYIPYFAREK